jgi:CrcB protein
VVAVGGACGAGGRYALERAWPTVPGGLPWATLVTNAGGCLAIGVLMVYVVEAGGAHPLTRPFLGVGVLGGYTTFSSYAVQTTVLADQAHPALAAAYLVSTVLAALLAVSAGVAVARSVRSARALLGHRLERRSDRRSDRPSDRPSDRRAARRTGEERP